MASSASELALLVHQCKTEESVPLGIFRNQGRDLPEEGLGLPILSTAIVESAEINCTPGNSLVAPQSPCDR